MDEQETTRILGGLLDAGDPGPVVRQVFPTRFISTGQRRYEQAWMAWDCGSAHLLGMRPCALVQDQPWHGETY